RKIEVRLQPARRGMKVLARRGYFAPTDEPAAAARTPHVGQVGIDRPLGAALIRPALREAVESYRHGDRDVVREPWPGERLRGVVLLVQRGHWALARRYPGLGLQRYPEDPRFLLARGSLLETQGAQGLEAASLADLVAATTSRRDVVAKRAAWSRGEMAQAEG